MIYWIATAIVCAVMVFSIVNFTFFDYFPFRKEHSPISDCPIIFKVDTDHCKVLGVLALLIPPSGQN